MSTATLRWFLIPLAVSLSLGAPAPAWAQEKDDREQKEERRVLRSSDYELTTADISEVYRQKAREKRHEEMEFAKELLQDDALQGERRAEMLLRLAELYFEEGRDIYLSEMGAYEKAFDACFNDPNCDSTVMQPDNAESAKWQQKSIKLYRMILENYPTFARADEATYYLGSALNEVKQPKEAVQEFTRLVKTYPESPFVPDAYVQIGEFYFDDNNAYKALLAYQKAAAYRDSDKYAFALYKLGWCYYNVGEYGKAIDTMKTVVAYSMSTQTEDGSAKKSNLQLQEEALKDLVRFFADAGEMDDAYIYFNKLGKKDLIRSMLKRLASTYFEQGKFEQAINTYRRLVAEDPNSPYAPEYQHEVIQCYDKMGRSQETIAEINRMLEKYGKNSAWARTNASNPDAIKSAQDLLEKNLRKVASDYHDKARKLRGGGQAKELYELAEKAYSVYIEEFPDSQYAYDMRYEYGELLYKTKQFDRAFVQYMKVVELDPVGKHSEFCAEGAIFAAREMVKASGGETRAQAGNTEAVPMGEWEQKKLQALDQYAKLFPNVDKTKNVIYESAYLLYHHNQFKEASDRFRRVISMDPQSKEAEQAANLILDSFALVEDWKNLREVSKAFYDQSGLGSEAFKKEIYGIYENASFKLIEVDFSKNSDKIAAANSFMAFYGEFPQSAVADVALNNASVYFNQEGRVADSMKARHLIIEKFPKSKFYNQQVSLLGYDYESHANFAEAAKWYEKLFSIDPKFAGADDAIYSAAIFREAMGDWQIAIKNYQQYMTAYPEKENVIDVSLEVGNIYRDHGDHAAAAKIFYAFFDRKDVTGLSADQLMYARMEYARALETMGQSAKATEAYTDALKWYQDAKGKGAEFVVGVEMAAEIMIRQAQTQYDKYMAMKVVGPSGKVSQKQEDKALTESLVAKAKALQGVESTYAAIIGTGAGEWGLAALVNLGKAYENMGESLLTSYIPSYLDEGQRDFYRMGLEDRAFPQVEKAAEAYATALQKSYELNLYNANLEFANSRLAAIRPEQYPELTERLLEPGYTSAAVTTFEFESSL